jgi:flagellar basal body-associated protein FliL
MNTKIIVIIVAALIGTGSGTYLVFQSSQTEELQKQKTAEDEALRQFLNQGDGTVRKPRQSGFKGF